DYYCAIWHGSASNFF
nr:immunoglobulin light chain junction region [Macaca mulatta]MOX79138.1 immunoglobulin light chain junction region [Macaca mulatta]MOX79829.1 immunoglobulin light chain junction region [Macaca mulatta]MOX82290.1 immunoglobulin light chain junction region [Macaca mulatta]MOX82603.1 immunoglobulin light chain junction region [Macaca mulatta]